MYKSFDRPSPDVQGPDLPLAPDTETPHSAPAPGRFGTLRSRPLLHAGLVALLIGVATYGGLRTFGGSEAQAVAPPPANVTVSLPLQRTITEWDDYTGRFEASQSVEIRPRVSGQLIGVHFREGEVVRKGQLLFTIDPRPFAASLDEARARVAAASTQLALARSEFARAGRLVEAEAISQEDVDALRAAVRSGEAGVAAAQAMVRSRALDLEFTRVRSPVTGRISDRRIDVGNLVGANEAMLTTVLALDPIHFTFDGSEALYLKGLRDGKAGAGTPQSVEIKLQDEADYSWTGKVDFTDNTVDPRSGTMRARAVIANPDYFLTPGMFGNMRLTSGGSTPALLVPDAAVRTDQARKIVLVVAKDGTVAAREVVPGPLVGGLRSIRSGLKPSDRVVIQGIQFAAPGSKVNPRPGKITLAAPADRAALPVVATAASQATLSVR